MRPNLIRAIIVVAVFLVGLLSGVASSPGRTTTITSTVIQREIVTTTSRITTTLMETLTKTLTHTATKTELKTETVTTTKTLTHTLTTTIQPETKTVTTTSTVTRTLTHTVTKTVTPSVVWNVSGIEVDLIAVVYNVVDGDTFDAFPCGRVRLADVNAPERDEAGYYEARRALADLILGRTVYLDVDDLYVMDRYNRLVAVVYVEYNSTHLLNVNKWLLDNGLAVISDYPNEFSPHSWSLYVAVRPE